MNVSIEVLKNNQNKYIFCRIEVDVRPIFYFPRQKRAHHTHRWLSTEQWAIYDKKLKELLNDNALDNLNESLTYKLNGSLRLNIKNSDIPKKTVYKTLNNEIISLIDVINVVDCKISYAGDDDDDRCNGSTLFAPIDADEGTCSLDEKPEDKLSSENLGTDTKHTDLAVASRDSSLINSSQKSEIELNRSPVFPYTSESIDSKDTQLNLSSESADIADRFFSKKVEFDNNKLELTPKEDNSSPNKLNKHTNTDSDTKLTPPEKRKRKLQYEIDENCEKPKDKEATSEREKPRKTDKKNHNDIDCKISKTQTSPTTRSQTAKKKKIVRERSQSPCRQEKRVISEWLSKSTSKKNEANGKCKSSPKKHDAQSSNRKQHNTPHKKYKPIQQTLFKKEEKEKEIIKRSPETFEEMLLQISKKEPILDLTKMSLSEMLATYEEHRHELESIFKMQKSLKKYICIDGVNHFFVINLVTHSVQQKLMAKLGEFETNAGAPKYGELFSMVLMPEWILRVFMKKFKMSRSEAIAHIKAQNTRNAINSFPDNELV